MSNHPNHRRGHGRVQDHGPGYESRTPAAGCNSTHVARSRTKHKRRNNRQERRTGEVHGQVSHTTRTRPQIRVEEDEVEKLETPEWIEAHIRAHGGHGWFYPIRVTEGHPLDLLPCFDCGEPLLVNDVAFVTPFHGEEGARWIWQHRNCVARQIFGPDFERVIAETRERERLEVGVVWVEQSRTDDGRVLYVDQERRELVQRPDGEWTILAVGMVSRLGLGTTDLDEAKRRADWTGDQWIEFRRDLPRPG